MTKPEELERFVRELAALALRHLGWPAEEPTEIDGPHDPYYEGDPEVSFNLTFSGFHILIHIEPIYLAGGTLLVIRDQPKGGRELFATFTNPPLGLKVH